MTQWIFIRLSELSWNRCWLQTVAIISIVFIIISTMVLTLNTLPYFSGAGENTEHDEDFPPFALLEAIYMSWFTFEFLVGDDSKAKLCVKKLSDHRTCTRGQLGKGPIWAIIWHREKSQKTYLVETCLSLLWCCSSPLPILLDSIVLPAPADSGTSKTKWTQPSLKPTVSPCTMTQALSTF